MGDVKPPAGLARNPKILLWVHLVIQEIFSNGWCVLCGAVLSQFILDRPAAAYRQTRERSNEDRSKWSVGRGGLKVTAEGQVRCVETQVTEFGRFSTR